MMNTIILALINLYLIIGLITFTKVPCWYFTHFLRPLSMIILWPIWIYIIYKEIKDGTYL